ncbi:MAG: DUF1853 family protein [Winogradskyella sp.]|nr:DUF1853 family protein [Winogradskyella sp.]
MIKKNTELQYNGLLNTPNLWANSVVFNLKQFQLEKQQFSFQDSSNFKEIRLGKRVEEFLSFQFKHSDDIDIISKNLQIIKEKITIGELDFLLKNKSKYIHLEVVYKFYLYDPNINSNNILKHWIGPNRKDTLSFKLNKLKEKQLPLLYSNQCKAALKNLKLDIEQIEQLVCYKAQLFLPFEKNAIDIEPLNKACIIGFYLSYSNIETLKSYQFFIPEKLDWLVIPHHKVDWMSFNELKIQLSNFINEEYSPMVWLKSPNDKLLKCFITFW